MTTLAITEISFANNVVKYDRKEDFIPQTTEHQL